MPDEPTDDPPEDDHPPGRPGRSGIRAIPPITWIGLLFAAVGLALQDVRALGVGAVCLVLAIVQGSLDR